jgi:type VI secretion system protein VasG
LEAATSLCQSRSHFTVEIDHWLTAMLEQELGDLKVICGTFGVNRDELLAELQQGLEMLKSGNNSLPSISVQVVSLLKQAWLDTSIQFGDEQIRSAYLIYTLLKDETLSVWVARRSRQLEKIDPDQLLQAWPNLQKDSDEQSRSVSTSSAPMATGKSNALDQFTIDLTEQAKSGKIDPILGRDNEIRQMADILTRRRQNNPILTGEAGVGKTAVVEGLALRIAQGDVPEKLKNVAIKVLDLALLQAGAGMKGEFENRLKQVINEVSASPVPIILFIDEAHTMIGSGGQAGQNDAANLLKPALARGELRTIAATTWAEYKKYFEKDAALTRRFQVVKVEEPSPEKAVVMMRGLLPVMENHHQVSISDQALQAAVGLSDRYINGRQLPDKAVGLLDTACARVAMSQDATPGPVEDKQRAFDQTQAEISVLEKEQLIGEDHSEKLTELKEQSSEISDELERLKQRWEEEKSLVAEAQEIANTLQSTEGDNQEQEALKERLAEIRSELSAKTEPMVHWQVTETLVAEVVSDWTGIPLGRMQADEIETILDLQTHLESRVIGQSHALELITKTVQTSRAHLGDENRPNGVFLLTGPSGVGKTETALAIAEQVYGSEDNITVINMSEFKEEHKVSLLLGSPPGYVGYGEGGVLTEAVRRKPYSVVLLDEMEKAHPGVQDIFYQVFDKGTIKDGEGRDIDFRNTIIIMTSNVGTDTTMRLFEDPDTAPSTVGLAKALKPDLLEVFKPAFLGRLNVIPYLPLDDEKLSLIAELQLQRVVKRMAKNYRVKLTYSEEVVKTIVEQCNDADSGARVIHNILQNQLLPELSVKVLGRIAELEPLNEVLITIENDDFVFDLT